MVDTKTAPADEIRQAAARIREIGSKAMPGPWESLNDGDRIVAWRTAPGSKFDDDDFEYVVDEPLEDAGTAEWIALANPDLAGPLASWLESTAAKIDNETSEWTPTCCDDTHDRSGLVHVGEPGCDGWVTTWRGHEAGESGGTCHCFDRPLAVARVLNGSPS